VRLEQLLSLLLDLDGLDRFFEQLDRRLVLLGLAGELLCVFSPPLISGAALRSRKSWEKKSGKWLPRLQPERKEKHRNGQRRANHEQHPKLSKLSARHDTNANAFWA
jgi:hypothetical protein